MRIILPDVQKETPFSSKLIRKELLTSVKIVGITRGAKRTVSTLGMSSQLNFFSVRDNFLAHEILLNVISAALKVLFTIGFRHFFCHKSFGITDSEKLEAF